MHHLLFKHIAFVVIIFTSIQVSVIAQEASITTNPYKNKIRIGEPIQVDIAVMHPEAKTFVYPRFSDDTITTNIELVSPIQIDTTFANSSDKSSILGFQVTLQITSFDSGLWAMPQIPFLINSDTILSEAFLIEVSTIEVDTSKAFAPIVQPMELPYSWREVFEIIGTYGVYAYVILFLLAILVYFLGKDPSKQPIQEVIPSTPPHQIAIQRLKELEEEQLLAKGAVKAYHIQLSDIVRQYIENRFNVLARESTTDEIKHMLKKLRLDTSLRNNVINSLRVSDLVKFAKANPEEKENIQCLQTAFDLVSLTIPDPQDMNKTTVTNE